MDLMQKIFLPQWCVNRTFTLIFKGYESVILVYDRYFIVLVSCIHFFLQMICRAEYTLLISYMGYVVRYRFDKWFVAIFSSVTESVTEENILCRIVSADCLSMLWCLIESILMTNAYCR